MSVLTPEEIEARKRAIVDRATEREIEIAQEQERKLGEFRFIRPLAESADGALEALENSDERFRLGLPEIDVLTRGFGAKELVMFTGFSHAGKTQLVNTAILNNAHKRVLFFSMDDPAEMIVLKLACMEAGIGAEDLERRVRAGDEEAKLILRQAASRKFQNLFVVDECLSIAQMDEAIDEAVKLWGDSPDCVIIDYLGSIVGSSSEDAAEDVRAKAKALKRWVKRNSFPTIVLHQQSRGRGGPGKPVTITSGTMGGEEVATILIGVRRKRDDEDLDEHERRAHANTITLHVVKNKRPPARITPPKGHDFRIDPTTGVIKSLTAAAHQLQRAVDREAGADE